MGIRARGEQLSEPNKLSPHLPENQLEDDDCSLPSVPFVSCHRGEKPVLRQNTPTLAMEETLDEILFKPLYFSAFLVVMAHEPTMRGARLCGTHQCTFNDDVPVI